MKSQALQTMLTVYILIAHYGSTDNVSSHGNSIYCSVGPCGPGLHLIEGTLDCAPCSHGTYMPMSNHSCHSCQFCTKPLNNENKIVVKNCTATSDKEIGCKSGYYLEGGPRDLRCRRCIVCRENEVETSPCGGRSKRVCSAGKIRSSVTAAPTTSLPISTEDGDESGMRAQIPTNETASVHLDRKNVAPPKDIDQFMNGNYNVNSIIVGVIGGVSLAAAASIVVFVYYIRTQRRVRVPTDDHSDDDGE